MYLSSHALLVSFYDNFFLALGGMAQRFQSGLGLGITASQIDGDGYGGFHQPGATALAYVNTDVSEQWRVQLEMAFTQKGSRRTPKPLKGIFDLRDYRVNYIDVPLLLVYRSKKFNYQMGPSANVLVSSREKDENGLIDPPLFTWKTVEWAFQLGISYPIFSDRAEVTWRYTRSLLPATDDELPDQSWFRFARGSYHSVMILSLRYQL